MQIDLSSVPADSEIASAVLEFFQTGWALDDDTEKNTLHTITSPWNPTEVTWESPWQSVGGDYTQEPSGESFLVGMEEWESYDITQTVQDMVNGSVDNNGFMLTTFVGNSVLRQYEGAHSDMEDKRPRLVVTYDDVISVRQRAADHPARISMDENVLQVSGRDNTRLTGVRIYNSAGQLSSGTTMASGIAQQSIDLSTLSPGVYIANIQTSRGSMRQSFIIR
ncbi:MAG: DNRLRE domain-containing protein [Fibrobacterota bacterium]